MKAGSSARNSASTEFRQKRARWAAPLFYAASAVLIALSLVFLLRLLRSFERDLESRVLQLQRAFSDRELLQPPTVGRVRFSAVEDLVDQYQDDLLTSFTVTKVFAPGGERIIYPFYAPALFAAVAGGNAPPPLRHLAENFPHPLPDDPAGEVRSLPLTSDGQLLGHLLVRVNQTPLRVVRGVIATLSILLVGFVGLFALQFRRQERVLSATTVELEEKRRELVRIERLAMAGQLSANLLHDLKKPVLNIKSEAEELAAADPHSPPPADVAGHIRQQVDLFFGILRESNLERFVRARAESEYVDLNELLDRSLALVKYERHDVEVQRHYTPELPPILAEPVRLIQVFSNLILNAYQAMEGRGRLTLTTWRTGSHAVVEVQDTGSGIPPEYLQKIFLPFFTTKPEGAGTGLGLYITRDIILDLGGDITVQSPETGGTRFRIELPGADEDAAVPPDSSPGLPEPRR